MKTVEFRDGERDVPDHIPVLMAGLRTWELTYDQAMELAHQNQLRRALDRSQNDMIRQHFKKNGPAS